MTRAYWWREVSNFGDALAPLLLEYYTEANAEWALPRHAEVVSIGSVLEHIPRGWSGHVLGSGRIREDSEVCLKHAQVHAVRGPLSAIGLGDVVTGDPGLLADELVRVPTRDIELGIVPHWSDNSLQNDSRFLPYNPVIIDPAGPPLDVVRMIGRCKKIVSSSLHGIILADAFGIPRRTEAAPSFASNPHEGNMFKFRDYNASVGVPFRTGETQKAKRGMVEDRKHELFDAFTALGRSLCCT